MSTISGEEVEFDHDVVVVGGGPAGCAVGVFTARYGLDTLIFDRGRSSIRRCAYLENFLGFPAGIDVETFYGLIHDHAAEAGCRIVSDMVESVERTADAGFVVEPQEEGCVTARRVVAATRYDGEYLRSLGGDAMFERHEHDDESHEHFDRSYPKVDGRTPVDGLYVASPSDVADRQAITAAGRGARVGLALVEDVRRGEGVPDRFADQYDWMRRDAELVGEWRDRDHWRQWFEDHVPDGHDLEEERLAELRDREIERRFSTYLPDDEIERRTERGHERLLEHVDDDLILDAAREIETARQSVQECE